MERILKLKSMITRVINDIDKMLTRLDDAVLNELETESDEIMNYTLQFSTKI